jgi:hypothetical protein
MLEASTRGPSDKGAGGVVRLAGIHVMRPSARPATFDATITLSRACAFSQLPVHNAHGARTSQSKPQ